MAHKMFVQRTSKMKIAEIESLGTDTLINVLYHRGDYPTTLKQYHYDLASGDQLLWCINSAEAIRNFGKPNVTMMDYENRPGAWVFDHEPTGIVLVVFSDGHRKDPYKGTSYELANIPNSISDADMLALYKDLITLITGIEDLHRNQLTWRERFKQLLFGAQNGA
jgi:hypothetical protein